MTTCSQFRFLIQQRFDYILSQQDNLMITQHLNSCHACSRFQHQIEQIIQSSASVPILEEYCATNIENLCEKIMQEMPKTQLGFFDLLTNLITGKTKKQLPENSIYESLKRWFSGSSDKQSDSKSKNTDYRSEPPLVPLNLNLNVNLPQQPSTFTNITPKQAQEVNQLQPEKSNVSPTVWKDSDSLPTNFSESKQKPEEYEYNQATNLSSWHPEPALDKPSINQDSFNRQSNNTTWNNQTPAVPEDISSSEPKQESSQDTWNTTAINPINPLPSPQSNVETTSSKPPLSSWSNYQREVPKQITQPQPSQEIENQSNIISRLSSILGNISIDEDEKKSLSKTQSPSLPAIESPSYPTQESLKETISSTDITTTTAQPSISPEPVSQISQVKQENAPQNLQEPNQPTIPKKQGPVPQPFSTKAKLTASAHKLLKNLDDKEVDKLFRGLVVKGTQMEMIGERILQRTNPISQESFVSTTIPPLERSKKIPQEQAYDIQASLPKTAPPITNNNNLPTSSSPLTIQEENTLQQDIPVFDRIPVPTSTKTKSGVIPPPKLPIPSAKKNAALPGTFEKMPPPNELETKEVSKAYKQQDVPSSSKLFKVDDAAIDKIFERLGIKDNTRINVPKINVSNAVNTVRTTAITTGAVQVPPQTEGIGKLAMPQASVDIAASGKIGSLGKFLLDQQDQKQISTLSSTKFRDTRIKVLTLEAANQLYQLLSHITSIPGVIGSCIVGHDGIAIANNLPQECDPELVGAFSLGIYHNTTTILKKLSRNHLFQLIAKSSYGYLIIADFGGGILITVTNESNSEQLILIVKTIAQLVSI